MHIANLILSFPKLGLSHSEVKYQCISSDAVKKLPVVLMKNYFHPRQFTLHDDVNLVEVAEEDIMLSLKKLNESGAVGNALVIVMVDHGHRFAKFRAIHHQGIEMHRYTCLNWESAMNDGKQANVSMMLSKAVVQSSHAKSQRRLCTPLKLICHYKVGKCLEICSA
ncbi:UvrABC system protein [Dirofilaria immitis]